MVITLAKALKLKNKLIGKISKISEDITSYNSTLASNEVEVDVRLLMEKRQDLLEKLIDLKYFISTANAPIQKSIFRMSELKGTVAFLKKINTKQGKVLDRYSLDVEGEYKSVFRKNDIDKMIDDIQLEIDNIQETLEHHNYNTIISIDINVE